jgi:hypothetical protein
MALELESHDEVVEALATARDRITELELELAGSRRDAPTIEVLEYALAAGDLRLHAMIHRAEQLKREVVFGQRELTLMHDKLDEARRRGRH